MDILVCLALSSSDAYIYLLPLEYHSTHRLKPLSVCCSSTFFKPSSCSSSSSYQRRDRCRYSTSHLFRILRWSSCSPQRHTYSTFRRQRTLFFSPRFSSITFLSPCFYNPHVVVHYGRTTPQSPKRLIRSRHRRLVTAPLSHPNLHVSHFLTCSPKRLISTTASL